MGSETKSFNPMSLPRTRPVPRLVKLGSVLSQSRYKASSMKPPTRTLRSLPSSRPFSVCPQVSLGLRSALGFCSDFRNRACPVQRRLGAWVMDSTRSGLASGMLLTDWLLVNRSLFLLDRVDLFLRRLFFRHLVSLNCYNLCALSPHDKNA